MFPDFKSGITPVRSVNSNMSSEEQHRLVEMAEANRHKQSLFKRMDLDKIGQRQHGFMQLMNTN